MDKLITSSQTSALSAFINKFHANTYAFVIQNSNYFELHSKFNLRKNPYTLPAKYSKSTRADHAEAVSGTSDTFLNEQPQH